MIQFDEKTHTYAVDGVVLPSVTHICRFLSYDYKSDRPWLAEAAARRGTAVHEACALIDYGEELEETPEIEGYLQAYRRFLADYQPDWELIEYPIGDLHLGCAGTLDRLGALKDERIPVIVDIKTGALHEPYLRAQLSAYRILSIIENPARYSPHIYALKLSREGCYEFREIQFDPDLFMACVKLNEATERKKRT